MKNLNTIVAAALFCSMTLVQRAQAQNYNAVQNFNSGWAASYPATSGGASTGFNAMPSTVPTISAGERTISVLSQNEQ
jgi:pectate lyase